MAKKKKPLERTIQFYVTNLVDSANQHVVPQSAAIKEIGDLPKETKGGVRGRYLMHEEHDECLDVAVKRDGSIDGRLHKTLKGDPPLVGDMYNERLVEFRDDDEGMRYPTHFVWWDLSKAGEHLGLPREPCGLLGMEFNVQGPRHSTLENYVNSFSGGRWGFFVQPIFDSQAWRRVKEDPYVKSVLVRGSEQGDRGWITGLGLRERVENAGIVKYEIRAKRRRTMDISRAIPHIEELSTQENIDAIVLEMSNGRRVVVGDTKVFEVIQVQRFAGGRYPDARSLYEGIRTAARRLRPDLERAIGRHLHEHPISRTISARDLKAAKPATG